MSFGLISTETIGSYESLNSRRKIFYQYPTGAAPLMGLLSMLPSEETDKAEFGWWERRFPTQRTKTVASGTAPFLNGDGSAFADPATMTLDVEYRVRVLSTTQFRATHVIEIRDVVYTAGATKNIRGTVTEVVSSTVLKFRPYETTAGVENGTTDNNSKIVMIIGTANQEGARSGTGISAFPVNPTNYTQIFRTAFNLTRTALKQGLEFDKSGPYKMMAKENGLRHMIEMEKAFLFGQKHEVLVADPDTGDQTPEKKTGGIIYFLEQWEAANSIYRAGQDNASSAITANSDDDKRIIDVAGSISKADYNTYIARLFKVTSDKAYEKLCFCGGKFLQNINTLFERDIVRQSVIREKEKHFEFMVHSHTTLRGTVHYKVHPLLDNDPDWEDGAIFMDFGNMAYRPLSDSDTVFLKGRQENDRDGRKDEWITEAGLELRMPESFMAIKNAAEAA